jgi:tetratricopeptide (TPR) repeat protein
LFVSETRAESNDERSSAAQAEVDGPSEARRLGLRGLSAYGKSDYEKALLLFQKAEATAHSPVFQLYIARCYLALSRSEEARALLYELSEQETDEADPEAWIRARAQAKSELAELSPTSDADPERAPDEETDEPFIQLPPSHQTAVASAPAKDNAPSASGLPPLERPSGLSPRQKGAVAAYTMGALGLVVMIASGAVAFLEASEVRAQCVDGRCPPEELPRAERARRAANIATAGGLTALTGATVGTLLVLWPRKHEAPSIASSPADREHSLDPESPPGATLELRPRGLGLELRALF